MSEWQTGSILMTHDVGLHARPSVKLTKLAKGYASDDRDRRGAPKAPGSMPRASSRSWP